MGWTLANHEGAAKLSRISFCNLSTYYIILDTFCWSCQTKWYQIQTTSPF